MPHHAPASLDWNVVVTVYEDGFRTVRRMLEPFGEITPTEFHNVLVMKVPDPRAFVERLAEQVAESPGLMNFISRAIAADVTFDFQTAEEFEAKAREAVLDFVPKLANKSFHVRMHRRGFKHRISSHEEERRLGAVLIEALEAAGTPGSLSFDDPDAIVTIETVGQRAGITLLTRDDLQRCPFLRID